MSTANGASSARVAADSSGDVLGGPSNVEWDNEIYIQNAASFVSTGARIIVGTGSTAETMLVTGVGKTVNGTTYPNAVQVLRGDTVEPYQGDHSRTQAIDHSSGTTVTLDTSQFYTQGDARIRFTEPSISTSNAANRVYVEKVDAGSAPWARSTTSTPSRRCARPSAARTRAFWPPSATPTYPRSRTSCGTPTWARTTTRT